MSTGTSVRSPQSIDTCTGSLLGSKHMTTQVDNGYLACSLPCCCVWRKISRANGLQASCGDWPLCPASSLTIGWYQTKEALDVLRYPTTLKL
ncbi:hypothetical protein TNCV_2087031 [Trichonephila clavipes]|nr:hypothetical protein TNCV_2087031 [Trichonephila clavipes]